MRATEVALTVIDLLRGDDEYRAACDVLDDAERRRAAAFRFDRDRRRWCLAHGGLRRALGGAVGDAPQDVRFERDELGKPRLPAHPGWHFNLSHARDVAVVAVTRLGPVGADIEPVRDLSERDALAERVFSRAERAQLAALPESKRTRAFFLGWTRKEALIKATGEGMRAPLALYSVELEPGAPARVLADERSAGDAPPWHLWHAEPRAGYVAAVAVRSRRMPTFTLD